MRTYFCEAQAGAYIRRLDGVQGKKQVDKSFQIWLKMQATESTLAYFG